MSRVGDWLGENTTTTGTGNITLGGQIAGYNRFNTLGDGVVYYAIVDGNNREAGIGTIAASTNILTRTTVNSTLVDGVYNDTSPTPISLSGTAQVFGTFNKQTYDDLLQSIADISVVASDAEQLANDAIADAQSVRPPANYIDNAGFFVSQHGSPLTYQTNVTKAPTGYGACDGWIIKTPETIGDTGVTLTSQKENVEKEQPYNSYTLEYGGTFAETSVYWKVRTGNARDFNGKDINISADFLVPAAGDYLVFFRFNRKYSDGTFATEVLEALGFTALNNSDFYTVEAPLNISEDIYLNNGADAPYTEITFEVQKDDGSPLSVGRYSIRKPQVTLGERKQNFIWNNLSREFVSSYRTFQKSFPHEEEPLRGRGNFTRDSLHIGHFTTRIGQVIFVKVDFPVTMRIPPEIWIGSTEAYPDEGGIAVIDNNGNQIDIPNPFITRRPYEKCFVLELDTAGRGGVFNNGSSVECYFNWTAESYIPD